VPSLIEQAGQQATFRFLEFFVAQIRNRGTRAAYGLAARRFFDWCSQQRLTLPQISPLVVATYIEALTSIYGAPTVKLHLAALRMLFDFLVTGQIMPQNPAASVRGPKHVVKTGKTPVLSAAEARHLLDSIETTTILGLRDRALIAVLVYSFARVSAAVGMNVEDYYPQGRRMWFRLQEKGGKQHAVPAHHKAEEYVDAYLDAAGIVDAKGTALFRSYQHQLTDRRMHRCDALRMVKRRAGEVGLPTMIGCHTFRATGITAYLDNGGLLEHAQRIAAHESARTTKLYDRTADVVGLDEIEKIAI
jgi:site-specific recombinase XerD